MHTNERDIDVSIISMLFIKKLMCLMYL